ncbi:hypothetical protein [Microlunatus parietis]|uniref:Uncharacterized protein n=1 Tax=Microlunatus parietis TaxID=682979 RepID=A0A7Y9I6B0_9ACTN|nr:hypothetical protein [Microlunatus parietis]NYE70836.1 hypothetical protein [Microlunatus parietis]
MVHDWDPDELYDERRPPNDDPLELDGDLEPDDRAVEGLMFGEPQDEVEDWLNDPEPDEAKPAPAARGSEAVTDDWTPLRRAVVLGGTAALGAVAILVAVLRRRG